MIETTGWLLDLYEDRQDGVVVWLLGEDGQRQRFRQPFPITFYASGPAERLRALWAYLEVQPIPLHLARVEKREVDSPQPLPVLAVEVARPVDQPLLFRRAAADFPDLDYFDADLQLSLRHAASFGTFPLARCHASADGEGWLQHLDVLDTPWDLDPLPAPLSTLELSLDADPQHHTPAHLTVTAGRHNYRLPLEPARSLLANLRAVLRRHDPDLLLTDWGDTWLLPHLVKLTHDLKYPLPFNREPGRGIARHAEHTYFSYGQIVYRGQQVHLFGRWHIDRCNAMLWGDYGLPGTLEAARVTALPVQTVARCSPGTGISAMQMVTALREGILVPWHKQQAERPKTALDLIQQDQGGLVYQPLVGLHRDVAEIDFVSMYPAIMVYHNISPETMRPGSINPDQAAPGLIPLTLGPLLKKRVALKMRLQQRQAWHPAYKSEKARTSAHKWLLVTCFGYLGYKNARFGRIEAHEAVTAWGRETLLTGKEAAEDMGYTVLQMYVDGLWVVKPGVNRPEQVQPLLDEIHQRGGLPINLDGIFRWVAFLPSRVDERVPVANRYFGVFQDGTIKMRGIEVRRRDTPRFIADVQMEMLECLAKAPTIDELPGCVPAAVQRLRQRLWELAERRVDPNRLLVGYKLSRKLEAYKSPSPAAQAAAQLAQVGKEVRPGQRVYFLFMRGKDGVHAWDLPTPPDRRAIDVARYRVLLLRAAAAVLQPLGVGQSTLKAWAAGDPVAMPLLAGGK